LQIVLAFTTLHHAHRVWVKFLSRLLEMEIDDMEA
jgi:hypothetical protein